MEKQKIKKRLYDVQSNHGMREYREFSYLGYSRTKIAAYVQKHLPKENPSERDFLINVIFGATTNRLGWSKEDRRFTIFIERNETDRFKIRVLIAVALGLISLRIVKEIEQVDEPEEENISDDQIIYFAQKVLERSAKNSQGSFLRQQYTLNPDDILSRMKEFRGDYIKQLTKKQRTFIDEKFEEIFEDTANHQLAGLLSSDTRLIERYIQREKNARFGIFEKPHVITTTVSDSGTGFVGKVFCHEGGCDIWYPSLEDVREYRVINNLPDINEAAAIRLILAHELSHIICHFDSAPPSGFLVPKATPEEEREATYCARTMLEHRELLYNNMVNDDTYKKACENIKELIRYVYSGKREEWGNEWFEWVLSD